MKLNAEQIKKALECCTSTDKTANCPIGCPFGDINSCEESLMYHSLSLITSQEQKIFELENRLKECENGYKGTNFLDRCKLHDAEEKVRKLTEENESLKQAMEHEHASFMETFGEYGEKCERLAEENDAWQKSLITQKENADKAYYELACEVENLRAENERLRDTSYRLECEVHRERADTVQKMQEEINKTLSALCKGDVSDVCRMIDRIAKEMLEIKECPNCDHFVGCESYGRVCGKYEGE